MADAAPKSITVQLDQPAIVDIRPLLQRLWPDPEQNRVTATEIAEALALIFTNQLSPVQTGSLLTALHFTGWDRRADVLAQASAAMRAHSAYIDIPIVQAVLQGRTKKEGLYNGGLVGFPVNPSDAGPTREETLIRELSCMACRST